MPSLQKFSRASDRPQEMRRHRILVVDDTVATRYAIGRHLLRSDFEVIEAGTGADALRLAREHKPDLITLDIHLPDQLGFDVARLLKSDAATSHIPILHLTASFVTDKDKVIGLEGGADSYLTHPVDPPVLIATIRALLRLGKADEELRESERRFRVLAETVPQMTWMTDSMGWPEFVNDRWVVYAGRAPRRDDRDIWREIADPSDYESVTRRWQSGLTTGETFEAEVRLRRADGVYRWHLVRAVPVLNEQDEILRWIGGATDIDEKKRLEMAVLAAKEEAESASRAKSQFLANMSHEIRTPLGVILGFSEIALEHEGCSEELRSTLMTIRRNATHLASLVDDVLDISKIEAGRLELLMKSMPLKKIVDGIRSAVGAKAAEKGLRLQLRGESLLPVTIETDETRVLQILINLVTNAVKFTAEGEVKVELRLVAGAKCEGCELRIRVSDTGIGISQEQQTKLFQVFSQADPSTTRRFGGSGLGLALSRRLAEALGGSLELVSSEPGQGSVFQLILPVRCGESKNLSPLAEILSGEAYDKRAGTKRSADLSGLKILLVEDSPDNQMLITRYLSSAGADVRIACDGFQGIRTAAEDGIDLVLMDIQMPEMDGFEATRRIRENGFEAPIIALTAHALKGDRERCLAAGCSDYLTKPITKDRLIEVIKKSRGSRFEPSDSSSH